MKRIVERASRPFIGVSLFPGNGRDARSTNRGFALVELIVALGILTAVTLPLAFSFRAEQQALRRQYYRAVAMEIVDGEMEVLAAGEWRAWPRGRWQYSVQAESAKNLPAGWFVLTVQTGKVRLEWIPQEQRRAAPVVREVKLK